MYWQQRICGKRRGARLRETAFRVLAREAADPRRKPLKGVSAAQRCPCALLLRKQKNYYRLQKNHYTKASNNVSEENVLEIFLMRFRNIAKKKVMVLYANW